MGQIISIVISLLAITFIVWWFFGRRDAEATLATQANGVQVIEIMVDGGFTPRTVQLKAGVPAKLIFNRKDPSSCLEEVLLPDFGVAQMLPLGEKTAITIAPNTVGEYKYSCGMQMFSGKVVVK